MKRKNKKLTEDQKAMIKVIRKKYRKFRGLYFKKKYLGNHMVMPRVKKVKIFFNDNLRRSLGRCWTYYPYSSKYSKAIEVNYEGLIKLSEKEFNGIIIHEMLHFIAKDTHGKHFKYLIDYVNRMSKKTVVGRHANIDKN